jgi:hypothetical protein
MMPDGGGGCCYSQVGAGPCGLSSRPDNRDCCAGLVCGSSNFCVTSPTSGTTTSGTAGGCPVGDGGDTCDTTADCNQTDNLVCSSTASATANGPVGGGKCEVAGTVQASCSPATTHCGGATDKVCCGVCVNSFCQDLGTQRCSSIPGDACTTNNDCCTGFTCAVNGGSGTCQPSCGQQYAACSPTNNNSDCCTNLGFTCLSATLSDGGASYFGPNICYNNFQSATPTDCYPTKCGPNGDAGECLLGTPCIPTTVSGAATDSCQAAGLTCDLNFYVCRNPGFFDPCLPGGPACNAIGGTNTDNLVCVSYAPLQGVPPLCLEPCQTNADCISPVQSCQTTNAGNFCFANSNPACSNYFGTCNAGGTNDGICFEITSGGSAFSACYQATLDGGGPGTACDVNASRQNPDFCDTSDICLGGICEPICNTSGVDHTCAGTNEVCVQDPNFGAGVSVLGACTVSCTIDDPSGGGCVTTDAGVPNKCYPGGFYSSAFPDNGTGLCVAMPATPLNLGDACFGVDPQFFDPCGAGMACIGGTLNGFFCAQMCTNVGLACPDGGTCTSINGLTKTGACI